MWTNGDLAVIDEIFDPHFSWGPETKRAGLAEFKQAVIRLRSVFPDLVDTGQEMIGEGDKLVVRWLWQGTHQGQYAGVAATGKPVAFNDISIFQFANGKIKAV